METIRINADTKPGAPLAATIGFFDGVHIGHRHLIGQVEDVARQQGLRPAVITFDRHPRQVVKSDHHPMLLSTFSEKLRLLDGVGVDLCAVLPFNEAAAAMSAHDFMLDVLARRLGVRTLVIGYDNRFGHNRSEGFDDYAAFGREMGISVVKANPLLVNGVAISSSVVRSLLQEGEVDLAAQCLGRHYAIGGTIVHGKHIGTGLGFPTANLRPDSPDKLVPANGVYAVEARIDGDDTPHAAVMNIGTRPTFCGTETTLEAHLLNFQGDIYGQGMAISFVARLRAERKFRSGTELANQLRRDAEQAKAMLGA